MSNQPRAFMVAHLIPNGTPRQNSKGHPAHIIAVPADSLDRPAAILTEDGKVWRYGGEYQHFPNTCFYIEIEVAYFSNRMMRVLSRAVPALERQGVI